MLLQQELDKFGNELYSRAVTNAIAENANYFRDNPEHLIVFTNLVGKSIQDFDKMDISTGLITNGIRSAIESVSSYMKASIMRHHMALSGTSYVLISTAELESKVART